MVATVRPVPRRPAAVIQRGLVQATAAQQVQAVSGSAALTAAVEAVNDAVATVNETLVTVQDTLTEIDGRVSDLEALP